MDDPQAINEQELTKTDYLILTGGFVFVMAVGGIAWWYLKRDQKSKSQNQSANTIQYGSRGLLVSTLQRKLNQLGASLQVDGIFGQNTLTAAKKWLSKTSFKQSEIEKIST